MNGGGGGGLGGIGGEELLNCIVLEHAPLENLKSFLDRYRDVFVSHSDLPFSSHSISPSSSPSSSSSSYLSLSSSSSSSSSSSPHLSYWWSCLNQLSLHIASALSYLHSFSFIFADLKPENILLFGSTQQVYMNDSYMNTNVTTSKQWEEILSNVMGKRGGGGGGDEEDEDEREEERGTGEEDQVIEDNERRERKARRRERERERDREIKQAASRLSVSLSAQVVSTRFEGLSAKLADIGIGHYENESNIPNLTTPFASAPVTSSSSSSRSSPSPPPSSSSSSSSSSGSDSSSSCRTFRGSLRWTSPEQRYSSSYSCSSDIYSFGLILWYLFTFGCVEPYQSVPATALPPTDHHRPIVPHRWCKARKEVVRACWEREPEKRPGWKWIMDKLKSLPNRE